MQKNIFINNFYFFYVFIYLFLMFALQQWECCWIVIKKNAEKSQT